VTEYVGLGGTALTGIAAGAGFTAGLRMFVAMGLIDSKLTRCAPAAAVQPVLLLAGLWAVGGEAYLAEAVAAVAICGVGGWLIPRAMDLPIRREFGVSSLDFVRGFLALVAFGEREIDEFFEPVAVTNDLPLGVFAARKSDGMVKSVMVVPYLHPGPFGTVGGGELPARLQRGLSAPVLVFHGTCNHDQNPASSKVCDRLADFTCDVIDGLEYGGASRSVRVEEGDVKVLGQRFGDSALLVTTLAPACTEDVELGVGLVAMEAARSAGIGDVAVVDAHNAAVAGPGQLLQGDPRSRDYIDACRSATRELAKLKMQKVEVGFAASRPYLGLAHGIGDLGITAAVVRVGGQLTAYVNIDGNNLVGGLRELVLEGLGAEFDHVEVTTSDSHVGNTFSRTNFVGENLDKDALVKEIRSVCGEALADLEPVETGGVVKTAKGLRVLGSQQASKLVGIVASMKHLLWGVIISTGAACAALSAVAFMVV